MGETWYETQHEAKAFSSYRLVLNTQWQCLICVRAGIIENWKKNININKISHHHKNIIKLM